MKIELDEKDTKRIEALAASMREPNLRGVPPKDRARVVVYCALEAGLTYLEQRERRAPE